MEKDDLKEIPFNASFPNSEILENEFKIIKRKIQLKIALFLSRTISKRVSIIYSDSVSKKSIQADITKITQTYIKINKRFYIPIHRVINIKLL